MVVHHMVAKNGKVNTRERGGEVERNVLIGALLHGKPDLLPFPSTRDRLSADWTHSCLRLANTFRIARCIKVKYTARGVESSLGPHGVGADMSSIRLSVSRMEESAGWAYCARSDEMNEHAGKFR